jgi:hypothetical protein
LPSSIDEHEYKLKPRIDAHIKFKEYQIWYQYDIEKLKDITRIEFSFKNSVNEINENKNKAYFVVLTGNDNEKN